ncbi:sensor histidine kinase [Amorphoplanes nipponensis]|uniref:Anti-sigma regulatory factor n=1 Tax=Actinoplanes nipponensis TaxID=135950 RepID=A0A919JDR7_9ACTN|nr:sensor histidine kinase [Actinoplanes nipponensis]GIE47326.1 anti-sigma regulatory factor [Actinoplanes nipponensis]
MTGAAPAVAAFAEQEVVAAMAPSEVCCHSALLYASAEEYLVEVMGFVRGGLAAGEPVAVAVPPAHLVMIEDALRGDAGRVRLIDMTDVGRNPGRILPAVLYAFADAFPADRVRIVSEPVWPGRTPEELAACVQHEALVNLALAERPIAIMCPYARPALDEAALADVLATHPTVIQGEGLLRSERYAATDVLAAADRPLPEPVGALHMSFDLANLGRVRQAAVAQARRSGMPERRVNTVAVVVSELATNAIKHGGGGGTLRIWTGDGMLTGDVRDRGRLDDPLAGRRPVPPTQLSGRGLLLVNLMTDLVRTRFAADGTTVRFAMAIGEPAGGEGSGHG